MDDTMDRHPLPTITGTREPGDGETALRILVIGSLYAAAVFFAVAFSPAVGFVNIHAMGDSGRIASAETTALTR